MASEVFYVCVYYEDDEAVGHVSNLDDDFPDKFPERKKIAKSAKDDSGFQALFDEFMAAMMGYLEYVPMILGLVPLISHRMVKKSLLKFLDTKSNTREIRSGSVLYCIDTSQYAAFRRFQENLQAASLTSRNLPRLLTVGLVTTLEYHLGVLMRLIALKYPDSIFGKDRTLYVRDAVKFNSLDDLKESVINDEIDKVQRESLDHQIGWIVEKTNMDDFRPKYDGWRFILELHERRNLFVHANGIVNSQYLKASRRHQFSTSPVDVGHELHAEPRYFRSSVTRVLLFGCMLFQVAWRKAAPQESEVADRAASNLGFELIARGEYDLAIDALNFAIQLRGVTEQRKRVNVVNLANAYKLAGNKVKSEESLSSLDWSAVSSDFKICIAAVQDDVEQVVVAMRRIGPVDDDMPRSNYEEWPVFFGVREDERFRHAFKEVFGVDYVPSSKRQAGIAQVLEFIDQTGAEIGPGMDDLEGDSLSISIQPETPDAASS